MRVGLTTATKPSQRLISRNPSPQRIIIGEPKTCGRLVTVSGFFVHYSLEVIGCFERYKPFDNIKPSTFKFATRRNTEVVVDNITHMLACAVLGDRNCAAYSGSLSMIISNLRGIVGSQREATPWDASVCHTCCKLLVGEFATLDISSIALRLIVFIVEQSRF